MDNPTYNMSRKSGFHTKEISFIAIMTALCIGSNFLMIGIVNVKFMDLFVFISGYIMGSRAGALVGILTWLVYGTLNPYGFNLPTLLATCLGESLYGLVGGIYRAFESKTRPLSRIRENIYTRSFWETNLKLGILGFVLTFIYDIFTNIITSIAFNIPIVLYIITGIPFTVTHEISNFFFFFSGGNALIGAIHQLAFKGGEA